MCCDLKQGYATRRHIPTHKVQTLTFTEQQHYSLSKVSDSIILSMPGTGFIKEQPEKCSIMNIHTHAVGILMERQCGKSHLQWSAVSK